MANRGSFLTALGAGYALANNTWAQARRAAASRGSELFFTADTTYGKVQGIINTGIKEFKGIPYGAARFTNLGRLSINRTSPGRRSPRAGASTISLSSKKPARSA